MFRTQSLNRGYNDRGLYGYRDHPVTQGPGQYTPYTVINTPTHRMVDPRYYPDRERSRDVLHGRDMEPMFLSLTTLERNQSTLLEMQGRPKKPDKALELLPKELLVEPKLFLTLPRATWFRHPHREEEITKRPQEERERYIRAHAQSTPVLLGMQDIGKQTHTDLSQTVQGSHSLMSSIKLREDPKVQRDWGGNVTTESVNMRTKRKNWGTEAAFPKDKRDSMGTGFGSTMVDKSLEWYRNIDEHRKRYLLESTRERMTRDAMNAFENQQKGERDE
jgi:hypothetical protein